MKAPLATATAIAAGIIILLGYFLPIPALIPVRALLLDWAVILATVSGLIAIIAMLSSHWKKLSAPKGRDHYSLFLILSFIRWDLYFLKILGLKFENFSTRGNDCVSFLRANYLNSTIKNFYIFFEYT